MRYWFSLLCVMAMGAWGCDETALGPIGGGGGDSGRGGEGGAGGILGQEFPCNEEGIREAIAEGGGPHTFDCTGVTFGTESEIVIDNDVILDGEGNLTVSGNEDHRIFVVAAGVSAELRGFDVIRGFAAGGDAADGGGILNLGQLVLVDSTVRDNRATTGDGGGIRNSTEASLVLVNTTVSGNAALNGGGIATSGVLLTLVNSTVSGNDAFENGGGIWVDRSNAELSYVTLSGNIAGFGLDLSTGSSSQVRMLGSIVDGGCTIEQESAVSSDGYNTESPSNTCGFDQETDRVSVTRAQLNLQQGLYDNGGPTRTHALGEGSIAIDAIPPEDCIDAEGAPLTTDQRGSPRPVGAGCDIGAFEVQP